MKLVALISFFALGCSTAQAGFDQDIRVALEEPSGDATYSAISNLRGWAVAPAGVSYVEVSIDGLSPFEIPMGGLRADVRDRYPDYPDSDRSGFSMAFNYKNLSPGTHRAVVTAFDNNGNYNEATVDFAVERFASAFIAEDSEVDFSSTTSIFIPDDRTIDFRGVTIEGRLWDFKLVWDKASQGMKIVDITYLQHVDNGGGGSDSSGQPPSEDLTISEACSSHVISISNSSVRFENGAELLNVPDGYQWDSEAYAYFIKYSDGKWIAAQYSKEALRAEGLGGWSAFWHSLEGYPPQPCEWRETKAARPFISNFTIGVLDDIYDEKTISVESLYEFREGIDWTGSLMYLEHSCQNWELGDYLFIPEGNTYNAHLFLNLTKAREGDGYYAFCRE